MSPFVYLPSLHLTDLNYFKEKTCTNHKIKLNRIPCRKSDFCSG